MRKVIARIALFAGPLFIIMLSGGIGLFLGAAIVLETH